MLKKILTSPWTALLTLALILSIRIADPVFVESIRLRYFDTLITQKEPTANNIYTVINTRSYRLPTISTATCDVIRAILFLKSLL